MICKRASTAADPDKSYSGWLLTQREETWADPAACIGRAWAPVPLAPVPLARAGPASVAVKPR
jgi:hypothetical protein